MPAESAQAEKEQLQLHAAAAAAELPQLLQLQQNG